MLRAGRPSEARTAAMTRSVEDFAFKMMTKVFNGKDTAPMAIEMLIKAGSFDLGPKGKRIEEPAEWSDTKILEKAKLILNDKGPAGKFDD